MEDWSYWLLFIAAGVVGFFLVMYVMARYQVFDFNKQNSTLGQNIAPTSQIQMQPPPKINTQPELGILTYFQPAPPTWVTGLQWDESWRLQTANNATIIIKATFDKGLIIGLGNQMSDAAGGLAIHLYAPIPTGNPVDSGATSGEFIHGVGGLCAAGASDIQQYQSYPASAVQKPLTRNYSIKLENGRVVVADLDANQKVIDHPIDSPNLQATCANKRPNLIRYIGFGTSCATDNGYRILHNVAIWQKS